MSHGIPGFEEICRHKLIPVIAIDQIENAIPLAETLLEAGLPVMEITFRTDCAADAIARIKQFFPEMRVGAGTIVSPGQTDAALIAGADFLVTPGFNPPNVLYGKSRCGLFIPGINSPSLAEQAMEAGFSTVKFFPAEVSGGIPMIKALGAVYPELKIMPTGGINSRNLAEYLNCPNVALCGGSWFVHKTLIQKGDWKSIKKLTEEALDIIRNRETN